MAKEWLSEHLETFVKPVLGEVPDVKGNEAYTTKFGPHEIRAIFAIWKEIKRLAEGRQILLPGRDVWLFEVLARIDDWPTLFRKEISSCVAKSGLLTEDFTKTHCLDTGYKGSVPLALGIQHWHLLSWSYPDAMSKKYKASFYHSRTDPLYKGISKNQIEPLKEYMARREAHQVFPGQQPGRYNYMGSRVVKASVLSHLCGTLESTPKYWARGAVKYQAKPVSKMLKLVKQATASKAIEILPQELNGAHDFKQAAVITRLVGEAYIKKLEERDAGRK